MSYLSVKQLAHYLLYPESLAKLSIKEWEPLLLVFRESKLLASLYHLLIKHDLFDEQPDYAKRHLVSAFVHAERQRRQVIFECQTLNQLLSEINVVPIYLKGANYILRESENSWGRIVSDIDLLVPKSDINLVENLLTDNLWKSDDLSDYDEKYYRDWAHEIPPLIHILRDTVLDVHHNLYLPISGRALDISLFKSGSMLVKGQHTVLDPADTVLHSIIHLFMNEDFTNAFRDLYDLYLLMTEFNSATFWQRMLDVATETGYSKEVYYCLKMLNIVFKLPAPNIYISLESRYKNSFTDFFINSILTRAVTPKHNLMDTLGVKAARSVIFIRGHFLKMPVHILLLHLSIKTYRGTIETIMGKHYFDKD
jgi:hypothetical protein